MPVPRVFISSTFYDLKYIRENLRYLVRNLGYEPILSEEGSVFYDPSLHVQEACLTEVPTCQMFVLVIGGRSGAAYRESDRSVTNHEYEEAVKAKVPIFALGESAVLDQQRVYLSNKDNPNIDSNKIAYPAVDSVKVFDFIERVRAQVVNNALFPFSDYGDIESYLRHQWAGMMYRFLTSESEARRVSDVIATLATTTEKIEFLTRQVVGAVASPATKLHVEFYDVMLPEEVVHDLSAWQLRPTPKGILEHETFDDFCGNKIEPEPQEGSSLTYGGPPYKMSISRYKSDVDSYQRLRGRLLNRLKKERITLDQFIAEVKGNAPG